MSTFNDMGYVLDLLELLFLSWYLPSCLDTSVTNMLDSKCPVELEVQQVEKR